MRPHTVLLGAGLAACLVSFSKAGPPIEDPCELISHAEIEEIVGLSIRAPEPSSEEMGAITYQSCSSEDVHIDLEVYGSESDAAEMYDFGTDGPTIGGLGDKARNTQPLGEVQALSGKYVVTVSLFSSLAKDAELAAATEIAKIVLDRLP